MALVPSGRVRIMEAQSLGGWNPALQQPEVQLAADESPAPRTDIQQQELKPDGGGQTPEQLPQQPEVQQQQPQQPQAQPQQQGVNPQQQQEQGGKVDFTDPNSSREFDPDEAKAYYLELLRQKNLLVRQITRKDENKLFQKNLSQEGVWSGKFFLPGYDETGENVFSTLMAAKFMIEFCKKFRLRGDLADEPKGHGYIVSWNTEATQATMGPGGAISDFLGGGAGEKKTGSSLTMGELLKARRNELFQTMRKIAGDQ